MLTVIRASRVATNPPILDDEWIAPRWHEGVAPSARRRIGAAFAASRAVRQTQRDVERQAVGELLIAFDDLHNDLQRALVNAATPGRIQVATLLAHVDRLLDGTARRIETVARGAYQTAADLGAAHASEPVQAAGFTLHEAAAAVRVEFPWKGDPRLANLAFDNSVDLLSDAMRQFRTKIATNVRRVATFDEGFHEQMLSLARDIKAAGFDNAEFRAERIVRTELGRTFNAATFGRLADLGSRIDALRKIWIRTRDNRTRTTHIAAGNTYGRGSGIAVDARFQVGAAALRFPIDPDAQGVNVAREVIMCRCNAAADFDEAALSAGMVQRVSVAVGGLPPAPVPVPPVPAPRPRPRTPRPPKPFDPAKLRTRLTAKAKALDNTLLASVLEEGRLFNAYLAERRRINLAEVIPGTPEFAEVEARAKAFQKEHTREAAHTERLRKQKTATLLRLTAAAPAARTAYTWAHHGDPLTKAAARRFDEARDVFEKLVGLKSTGATFNGYKAGRIGTNISEGNTRASALNGRPLDIHHIVSASKSTATNVIVHELGHTLEYDDPRVLAAAVKFWEQRTAGTEFRKLADIEPTANYKAAELTKEDKFLSPYMGKVYIDPFTQQVTATELVSMGVEWLYEKPDVLARDPEYFDFIVRLLRGIFD